MINVKGAKYAWFLIGFLCLHESCKKGQIADVLRDTEFASNLRDSTISAFDEYVRKLAYYSNRNQEPYTAEQRDSNTADVVCTKVKVRYAPEFNELYLLNPTTGVIFLGNLLDGNSILDGSYRPLNGLNRDSITISLSTQSVPNGTSSIQVLPILSHVRNGLNQLLRQVAPNSTTAFINFEILELKSEKAVQGAIGVNASGWGQEIKGGYSWNNTEKKSTFMIKFYQKYYTADMDKMEAPHNWFKTMPNPTTWGNSSPVYVSSVTYGRSVYFMVESSSSASSMKATLSAAFKGGTASMDVNLSLEQKDMIEKASIKALVVGGSASAGVKTIHGVAGLKEYIDTGGDFSINSPGAPISYELRFMKDNSLAKLVLATEYEYEDCEPLNKVDITLKGISLDRLHNGDCSRVWGYVDVEAWETDSNGIIATRVMPITENGIMEDKSRMMDWARGSDQPGTTAVTDYAGLSNYKDVVNANRTWSFKLNPRRLNKNQVVLIVKTDLKSAHKSGEFAGGWFGEGYTESAGMSGEIVEKLDIKNLLDIKKDSTRFLVRDGPFIVGPYIGADRSHHAHRVHFDIKKN
ncbi:MAG: hypothetical protein RLZZ628_756 [Bacteroidota bacterium]